jgi:transposase-like protein
MCPLRSKQRRNGSHPRQERNLARWGLRPEVVFSDGSNLYPELLAQIWPQARHQLCVFHLLRDLLDKVLAAVR